MSNSRIVVAIDGHSSCGKSTIAKAVAARFGYVFIDSGAMYRAVTLYALRHDMVEDGVVKKEELINALPDISIEFRHNPALNRCETFLNGENVEDEIRQLPVSRNVSQVAVVAEVRAAMVDLQQQMGKSKGIVMDGRDIGTVVFPDAELKIFVTASASIRAKRRFDELTAKGENVSYDEILQNVQERDRIDSTRETSPLRKADDALVLDNTNMTREEQLEWAIRKVEEKIK
ncbi:MAG TPA: (d)CMP kinase [Prolixibacteraceae bacterium]|nr:(d)CMP kinase [Prolixibacteraceae bacterium]